MSFRQSADRAIVRNLIGIGADSLMQPRGRGESRRAEPQPQEQHPDGESARARKALRCVSGEHSGYFKHEFDGEARVEIRHMKLQQKGTMTQSQGLAMWLTRCSIPEARPNAHESSELACYQMHGCRDDSGN